MSLFIHIVSHLYGAGTIDVVECEKVPRLRLVDREEKCFAPPRQNCFY